MNSRNKYGWTSLHRASMEGHLDIVRSLCKVRKEAGESSIHAHRKRSYGGYCKLECKVCLSSHKSSRVDPSSHLTLTHDHGPVRKVYSILGLEMTRFTSFVLCRD